MAVDVEEQPPSQSTQQSTQPTQDALLDRSIVNTEIWGSLIPVNPANPRIKRIDFLKTQTKYTLGRSRQNDIPFRKCVEMSECFWSIDPAALLFLNQIQVLHIAA